MSGYNRINTFRGGRGNRNERIYAAKMDVNKKKSVARLLKFIFSNYKLSLSIVVACIAVSSFATLLSTLFTKTLIDNYIIPIINSGTGDFAPLKTVLVKFAVILVCGAICAYMYDRLMIKVSNGTMLQLRMRLFDKNQRLPLSYFDKHRHGALMSHFTNDIDSLRQMIGNGLPSIISSMINITITLISMLMLSIPLTFVSMVMAAVMVVVTTSLGKYSRKFFVAQQVDLGTTNAFIEEMLEGQRVVKTFGHEQKAVEDFEQINNKLFDSVSNANKIANIVMPINGNLGNITYVLIAVIGGYFALGGDVLFIHADFRLSIGTLVAFLTLNRNFARPIANISQEINSILNASAGAERVFDVLDEKEEKSSGSKTLTKYEGKVEFKDVNFSYDEDNQILYNIDIVANPGEKIALVGGTGAGKTTVVNLINKLYDIDGGEILIDGMNIDDLSTEDLRKNIAVVLQDITLFSNTIMENIRYGNMQASDEDCIRAAKMVGADVFISRLPDGYNTIVDSNGSSLSQGECQLLTIARAAVANPAVLILDEATSSVDTRTERIVQEGMDKLMSGRTTFVIAHRLSTVKNADRIYVIEHGRVVESGNHHVLMQQHGRYYKLYSGGMI